MTIGRLGVLTIGCVLFACVVLLAWDAEAVKNGKKLQLDLGEIPSLKAKKAQGGHKSANNVKKQDKNKGSNDEEWQCEGDECTSTKANKQKAPPKQPSAALGAVGSNVIMAVERDPNGRGFMVVDDSSRMWRLLVSHKSILGGHYNAKGTPPIFSLFKVLEAVIFIPDLLRGVSRTTPPTPPRFLQIGLGTGTTTKAWVRAGIKIDVVDISPSVIKLATNFFGFVPNGDVFPEDANVWMDRMLSKDEPPHLYNAIIHDVFDAGTTDPDLLTVESLEKVKRLLAPNGVLVINAVGFLTGTPEQTLSAEMVLATVVHVFPNVRCFADHPPSAEVEADLANVVCFASVDTEIKFEVPKEVHDAKNDDAARVWAQFQDWEVLEDDIARLRASGEISAGKARAPVRASEAQSLVEAQRVVARAFDSRMSAFLPDKVWAYIQ